MVDRYSDDIDAYWLKCQLALLRQQVISFHGTDKQHLTLPDITEAVVDLPDRSTLLSEVMKVCELVLVAAATDATSKRSFSALGRVKTFLRTTMTQARLNTLMVLHVHKDLTDSLDLIEVARDFTQFL